MESMEKLFLTETIAGGVAFAALDKSDLLLTVASKLSLINWVLTKGGYMSVYALLSAPTANFHVTTYQFRLFYCFFFLFFQCFSSR